MEVSLRKAGYQVTTARDGADALAKLESARPDLIISDTEMPNVSGFEFCRRIKSGAHAQTPFLFLTTDNAIDSKVKGLEAGADDYLIRPIFTRELAARVSMILERKERQVLRGDTGQQRYFGELEKMGIVDLLQAMEMGRKSGTISVNRGDVRGTLWFRDGELIDSGTGSTHGPDAVYRMLTWETGRFEIDFRPPRRPQAMNSSVQSLIDEGMRQVQTWSEIAEQLPPLETVMRVDYGELADRIAEFPDRVNELIRLFDGQRTTREAVSESNLPDLAALETVSQLYFEGVIAVADGQGQAAVEPTVPDYKTSMPPAVQPTVADALLESVEALTGRPIAARPESERPQSIARADTVIQPNSRPAHPPSPMAPRPVPSAAPKETGAPPPSAAPDVGAEPPPPPPEAFGDLAEALSSVPEAAPAAPTPEVDATFAEPVKNRPTEPAEKPSMWDVKASAKATQLSIDAASKPVSMALMTEEKEDVFPEFDGGATLSEDEEDAFFHSRYWIW
jgi:CheY-like chemotaxis protein